jgi:predicted glycoside hydrolase/deacetylase ChbG (UPF0249 family)
MAVRQMLRCYTNAVRRLIINADDFGLTRGVNRGIVRAHEEGIVTSATLMASSEAFADAASMALSLSDRGARFSIGCHMVLLDGEPVLPPDMVPTLLQPALSNGSGKFRTHLSEFAVAAVRGKLDPVEIEMEAAAQLSRLKSAGIEVSHFDTHKHAHMFPLVLRPLLCAARSAGIRAVRNPFGRLFPLPLSKLMANRKLWSRFAEMSMLRSFASKFAAAVKSHGMRTTDGSFGVLVTGVLDLELFTTIANAIPEGTWEFVCHPGYEDAALDGIRTRLRKSRVKELDVLTSPEARRALECRGVELISYHEL